MSIRINNVILDINEEKEMIESKALKKARISVKNISEFKILRESIDARKKNSIKFNYTVEISCDNEEKVVERSGNRDVMLEKQKFSGDIVLGNKKMNHRPIIIGMGPAGMFAGLFMAKKGYRPIIFERGQNIDDRTNTVNNFWNGADLNPESNVQFGEGGAGTFSDGKLTTRIKDPRCEFVLEEFVKAGAPKEIIYSGKPHIGTDILKNVVKNIRKRIIELGGDVRFESKLQDIIIKDNALEAVNISGAEVPCNVLIAAIGHSSRDTYEMLYKKGISMEVKPFAIGVRVEHLQKFIDENQYGKFAGNPKLSAADYRLSYTSTIYNRGIYSFCMCPGGVVSGAASETGRLVTNGMSYYRRDGKNANAAIVVTVDRRDFEGSSALSGMEFQRHYEKLAYDLCSNKYYAPIELMGDFLNDRVSKKIGSIEPTYKPGYEFKDLRKCLPKCVVECLKEGFLNFDKKIRGFACSDAVLTGIETRTSAPLRILRGDNLESISTKGLYPAGEGAGYAGGIVSSAVDGIKAAENIMKIYSPM